MDDEDLFHGMTGDEWNALHDRLARLLCHQHDFDWDVIAEHRENLDRPRGEPTREAFEEMAAQVIRLVMQRDPLDPSDYPRAWSRQVFDEGRAEEPDGADPAYAPRGGRSRG